MLDTELDCEMLWAVTKDHVWYWGNNEWVPSNIHDYDAVTWFANSATKTPVHLYQVQHMGKIKTPKIV